jgi:hypothetical protein
MQVTRIEEYLKLGLEIDEMSEQLIINVETVSYNSSCDTDSSSDQEMNRVDPLDS